MSSSETESIRKLKAFCAARALPTTGVMIITVQKNRTGHYASLVADLDSGRLLPNYPSPPTNHYQQIGDVPSFNVTYVTNLAQPTTTVNAAGNGGIERKPFCCGQIKPYKEHATSMDTVFDHFVHGHGHHPGIIYEVRCQRDNGPLLSTDYFRLTNQASVEQVYGHYEQKRTAYKCYKCALHSLFYAVNLFSEGGTQGANRHHIRLYPFTKRVDSLLDEFFRECNIN